MKHLAYIILCFVMLFNIHLVNAQGDVTIGTQIWTSKNLDVSTFRNGEAIPEAKSKEEWAKAYKNKTAAFCYYDYDNKNGKVYGKLYNWYAVNDPRGLAPKGYHIPSDEEWTILTNKLGGEEIAGKKMKSKSGWEKIINKKSVNGDNSSGFNALPGGCNASGDFNGMTAFGYFWSSSENYAGNVWYWRLCYGDAGVFRSPSNKNSGFSVRCLRD
jgi:uncharacterized protein (TIGR02145 family)